MFGWLRRLWSGSQDSFDGVRFIVVGLGNPGAAYKATRHNIGFMVVDEIAGRCGKSHVWQDGNAQVRRCELPCTGPFALVKPLSFMNRSGEPAGKVLSASGRAVSECVVVVDDVNLELGRIRVRRDGSDGGHNGLKSMIAAVGEGFPRVRVGVGPAPKGGNLIDFVLGRFPDGELERMQRAVRRAADAVVCVMTEGIEAAMGTYN